MACESNVPVVWRDLVCPLLQSGECLTPTPVALAKGRMRLTTVTPRQTSGVTMIYTVSSNAELAEAFASASDGDHIALVAGNYDAQTLRNRDFDTPVTIRSADAADPAVFRGALTLKNVDGIEVSDLRFAPDGQALDILDLVLVTQSANVTLTSNAFVGHIPVAGEGLPIAADIDTRDEAKGLIEGQAFARGLRVSESQNVTVQDNVFTALRKGIILDRVQQVDLQGNHLHDLRSDGINLVDAVSVTIAGNLMESFRPLHNYDNIAHADHGDFIQWWAGSGGLGIRDLTIRDNALLQGSGSWVQGIFGRSGSAHPDGSPAEFENIRIQNNLINTSHSNGIFVGDARNVEISGNTLLPAPQDLTQPVITSGIPTIHIRTSANLIGPNEYDFSTEGALPQHVSVRDNIVVGEHAFTSYQIDSTLYAQLNLSHSGNALLSGDAASSAYWGRFFPDALSIPLESSAFLQQTELTAGVDPSAFPQRLQTLLAESGRHIGSTQQGTEEDDNLTADGSGRILDAGPGNDLLVGTPQRDVMRGGEGSDRIVTGAGPDRIAFHRSDLNASDIDTITDLDFDAGDYLVFSGGFGAGFFDDEADPTNAMTTFGSGDSAIVHDRADLVELIAQDAVSAHATGTDSVELRFDLDGDTRPDWTLRLLGISDVGELHSNLDDSGLTLIGSHGHETLTGGEGDDWLMGNGGSDVLSGGAGADTFELSLVQLASGTHIMLADLDFSQGDRIRVTDVPQGLTSDNLAESGGAGELWLSTINDLMALADAPAFSVTRIDDAHAILRIDTDADGAGDVMLMLGDVGDQPLGLDGAGLLVGSTQDEVLQASGQHIRDLFAGAGDDLLIGRSVADRMFGGLGDDRYYVDSTGDLAIEAAEQGYDRVYTSVHYVLQANLEAISAQGANDLRLTGNAQDNWVSGNAGANMLSGREGADRLFGFNGNDWLDGGIGADVLQGGNGSDRYFVDAIGDLVIEHANEGYDRVETSVDFTLGQNIEALAARGVDDLALAGNAISNWLTGNAGNNDIHGMAGNDRLIGGYGDDVLTGGAGQDVLQGGQGRDVFRFSDDDGIDLITDFESGSDMLLLDVISSSDVLRAVETTTGVHIHYGAPGNQIVLQGMTQASLQTGPIFADGEHWVLDF